MVFLANAFSLQMLPNGGSREISVTRLTEEEAIALVSNGFVNAVGHADTAKIVGDLLGCPLGCERVNIKLRSGDTLLVAQVTGGRLPEGATKLPPGTEIVFEMVTLK